ncbi:MAG: hypothetical protein R2855_04670 [Thermomicrobiales bacterium]
MQSGRSFLNCPTAARGELDDALEAARERAGQFALLDVRLDKLDFSPALKRLGEGLNKAATAVTSALPMVEFAHVARR